MASIDFDANPEIAARYLEGPRRFIPGYGLFQGLIAVHLGLERPPVRDILVVGAGGGEEVITLGKENRDWRLTGVDPSANMIELARRRVEAAGLGGQADLRQGYAGDAPPGPFDAATLILTLALIPDDGAKLETLREIRRRLGPGRALFLVDGAGEIGGEGWDDLLRFYEAHGRRNGADAEFLDTALSFQSSTHYVSETRNRALLAEAGFTHVREFYRAGWIVGWISRT